LATEALSHSKNLYEMSDKLRMYEDAKFRPHDNNNNNNKSVRRVWDKQIN